MATVHCPHCSRSYRVSAEMVGRRVKCRNCGEMFEAQEPAAKSPGAAIEAGEVPSTSGAPGSVLEVRHADGIAVVRLTVARINSENVEQIGEELLALADAPA